MFCDLTLVSYVKVTRSSLLYFYLLIAWKSDQIWKNELALHIFLLPGANDLALIWKEVYQAQLHFTKQ